MFLERHLFCFCSFILHQKQNKIGTASLPNICGFRPPYARDFHKPIWTPTLIATHSYLVLGTPETTIYSIRRTQLRGTGYRLP
jgi:hypothetical protein